MKKTLSMSDSNLMYIPRDIEKVIGNNPRALMNCSCVVLYAKGTSYEDVKESLGVILRDIKLRIKQRDEKKDRVASE